MQVTLGMDAAWGGLGWGIATEQGPLARGWVDLSGRAWRWPSLRDYLREHVEPEVADAALLRIPTDPPLRLVVEMPPAVYTGAERFGPDRPGKAGNQALTCFGLGRLAGALELWWWMRYLERDMATAGPPTFAYPWLVAPRTWRGWWKLGGRGRGARKRAAVEMVQARGWGAHLVGLTMDEKGDGSMADVAEGLLLAVGASRRPAGAPKGPARRAR